MICTCPRINWEPTTASKFRTHRGVIIDLGVVTLAAVRNMVKQATASEAQHRPSISIGVPALDRNIAIGTVGSPMRSRDLTTAQRTTVGTVVANGVWTCGRLFQPGVTLSPLR